MQFAIQFYGGILHNPPPLQALQDIQCVFQLLNRY